MAWYTKIFTKKQDQKQEKPKQVTSSTGADRYRLENSKNDDFLLNPLNPLSPFNTIYDDPHKYRSSDHNNDSYNDNSGGNDYSPNDYGSDSSFD